MIVTIKHVAERAGVSAKTVSRVMNGEAHVRASVRETVMRAVDELGYRPNAFARSLSSARSYLIGLFFDDPASGYAVAMQRGALASCRERPHNQRGERLDGERARAELAAAIGALRLDGAILTPPLSQAAALLDELAAAGIPHVCISPDPDRAARCGIVDIDESRAAFDMTERLLRLGHCDIGFIEGDPAHASTRARRAGFTAAMTAARQPIAAGRIQPGDFSFRAGLAAAEALIAAGAPQAIFASNDDMALGASVAALKHGLEVPGRLAVAGFDDAPTSRIAWPPITTVRQPVEEMGAAAVAMLTDPGYRRGDLPPPRVRLPYELIERESTAASDRR